MAASVEHPIFAAIKNGDAARVRELLSAGDEGILELDDNWGRTPLMIASDRGRDSCVELLLKAGADCDDKFNDGHETPLYFASARNHPSTVSVLLAAGASVDSASNDGWTPLMEATHFGYSAVVRLLLDGGANIELKNIHGQTAFDIATRNKQAEVVAILREHERLEKVVRPAVVGALDPFLPVELAELCGRFIFCTRRRKNGQ